MNRATQLVLLSTGLCFFPGGDSRAVDRHPLEALEQATALYEVDEYEVAWQMLRCVDPLVFSDQDYACWEALLKRCAQASQGLHIAREDMALAELAIEERAFDEARALLEWIRTNEHASIELRIFAQSRLSKIDLLERESRDAASTPGSQTPPHPSLQINPRIRAGELIEKGMSAIECGAYDRAQLYFNRAARYVPDAPRETIYVSASSGMVFGDVPPARVFIAPRGHVTMNLQLGLGRLSGMNSFPFSDSPTTGKGFVQLPTVQRSQIKTSATAPAYTLGIDELTFVQDYYVLVRPRLE